MLFLLSFWGLRFFFFYIPLLLVITYMDEKKIRQAVDTRFSDVTASFFLLREYLLRLSVVYLVAIFVVTSSFAHSLFSIVFLLAMIN